jgi:hypothetical protein
MNYVELNFTVCVKRWRTNDLDRIEWIFVVRTAKAKLKLKKEEEERGMRRRRKGRRRIRRGGGEE